MCECVCEYAHVVSVRCGVCMIMYMARTHTYNAPAPACMHARTHTYATAHLEKKKLE